MRELFNSIAFLGSFAAGVYLVISGVSKIYQPAGDIVGGLLIVAILLTLTPAGRD